MWKLKLNEDGSVALNDKGQPIWVNDKGQEMAQDVNEVGTQLTNLRNEAAESRRAKEKAETDLKKFEGIDPEQARKDRDTVQNLDDKKLVDAGEIQRVKDEAIRATEEKYKPVVVERDNLEKKLMSERLTNAFNGSEFVTDKLVLPADLVQARFGTQFKFEEGKFVGYDSSGSKIYSDKNPGQPADFEEALQKIVEGYVHRDAIVKGNDNSGGDANHGNPNTGVKNPWKSGASFSLSDQDKLERDNPSLAKRLKAEAGVA